MPPAGMRAAEPAEIGRRRAAAPPFATGNNRRARPRASRPGSRRPTRSVTREARFRPRKRTSASPRREARRRPRRRPERRGPRAAEGPRRKISGPETRASCRKLHQVIAQSVPMGGAVLKIFIVALALALDVFAVSVGVGVRGVRKNQKLRIGLAFACAEVTMNVIGAGLGLLAGKLIGDFAGYIGFAALFGLGIYMIRESRTELSESSRLDLSRGH